MSHWILPGWREYELVQSLWKTLWHSFYHLEYSHILQPRNSTPKYKNSHAFRLASVQECYENVAHNAKQTNKNAEKDPKLIWQEDGKITCPTMGYYITVQMNELQLDIVVEMNLPHYRKWLQKATYRMVLPE
jgi:hypothetical protein